MKTYQAGSIIHLVFESGTTLNSIVKSDRIKILTEDTAARSIFDWILSERNDLDKKYGGCVMVFSSII